MKFNKFKAFTLAEVLITLGIIGVVAAITIPTLIANYQKKVCATGLKVGVSTLEQGFKKMMVDEGIQNLDDSKLGKVFENEDKKAIEKYMSQYFKILNIQTSEDIKNIEQAFDYNCFKMVGHMSSWWTMGRAKDISSCRSYFGTLLLLENGMPINIHLSDDGGSSYATIMIDVNGGKGPNVLGIDAFGLLVLRNGRIVGQDSYQAIHAVLEHSLEHNLGIVDESSFDEYYNTKVKHRLGRCKSIGFACSGIVMDNGWEINY